MENHELPGYKVVQTIYETRETLVCRARDLETGDVVIIKMPAGSVCTPVMLERIRQEYGVVLLDLHRCL